MMYHKMECPWCGNEINARATGSQPEHQKCKWCRRYFSVTAHKAKGKMRFEAKEEDFDRPYIDPAKEEKKPPAAGHSYTSGLEYGR